MLFNKKKFNYFTFMMLFFKLTPGAAIMNVIKSLLDTGVYALSILIPAAFINNAIAILNGEADMSSIVLPIILLVAMSAYGYLIEIILSLINKRADIKIMNIADPVILEKKAKLKFRYYENQETMDVISRAAASFKESIRDCFQIILGFLNFSMKIFSTVIILWTQVWWAAIILFILSVPIYIISYRSSKKMYEADKEMTKIDRKVGYYQDILISRDTIEERYNFGFTDKLNEDFRSNFEKARIYRKKVDRRRWISMKSTSIIVTLSSIAIVGLLIPNTVSGDLTIGLFTTLATGILSLGEGISWSLSWFISQIKYKIEYIKDVNKFIGFEEKPDTVTTPHSPPIKFESLEFRNVNFKYPGTEPYILKDMSFNISSGNHYAIVGANGAGKTTITKLITGLYDEYEGEILLNGKNIREFSEAELKSLSSVVYQDFARFPLSFYNNIAVGNINYIDNNQVIEEAVSILNLDSVVDKLPDKYDTPLTKVKENGVDLSGGEWQRVALARTIVNPAPIKILDEPTAALDPISESRVYEQFNSISNYYDNSDSTVIFISHRLGSTKIADIIFVIDDGKVIETGTFDELMSLNGLYAEMFTAQSEWYKSTEKSEDDIEKINEEVRDYVGK